MANQVKRNELPEISFSTLKSTGDLILIHRGETGYYPSDWSTGNRKENKLLADFHNRKGGFNAAQVRAMEIGSMFGFDAPAANPQVFFNEAKLLDTRKDSGTLIVPDTGIAYPIPERTLLQYNVAGHASFFLALDSLPRQLLGRESEYTICPDLIAGKPLVPVKPEWADDGTFSLTLEPGGFVKETEINADYQIIAKVGVGLVEYALAELTNSRIPFFATWERTPGNDRDGEKNYYWGHYLDNRQTAIEDFSFRASEKYEMLTEQRKPSIRAQLSEAKQEQEEGRAQQLTNMLNKSMEAYRREWYAASAEYLVADASFVAAIKSAHLYLTETHRLTPEEVNALLKMRNPLHTVAVKCQERMDGFRDMPAALDAAIRAEKKASRQRQEVR